MEEGHNMKNTDHNEKEFCHIKIIPCRRIYKIRREKCVYNRNYGYSEVQQGNESKSKGYSRCCVLH